MRQEQGPQVVAGDRAEAVVLVRRLALDEGGGGPPAVPLLQLPLTADQRCSLRGHRRSACGRNLVLQLPRGEALQPGELLLSADGALQVRVEAAPEPVMRVRSTEPLALLQAAYHLGNRHVAMELHTDQLVLLQDSVLADLLRQRGLQVECTQAPFRPEAGAYAGLAHGHSHGDGHSHAHR
ncbi:MAG: urease accessory protein UreE [Cyanobacteriota bacterium]